MDTLKTEHILMVLIAGFLLYRLMGSCGCSRGGNGFRVGGQQACNQYDGPVECSDPCKWDPTNNKCIDPSSIKTCQFNPTWRETFKQVCESLSDDECSRNDGKYKYCKLL
jgi:hypothetical protein